MNDYADEMHSPTGLERLARLLATTREDAAAEISMLTSQVEALQVERHTLQAELETCRDQLGDANSLVEQLRLENTRKWRVEERDDWRALLDSIQDDRTALQQQNTRLEAELTRCVAALSSIFPPPSPEGADPGALRGVAGFRGHDHPPELTHRIAGSRRSTNPRVDLEWLSALAEEFNVVCEHADNEEEDCSVPDGRGDGDVGPGSERSAADNECARLRLELDALKHEACVTRAIMDTQEEELERLRQQVSHGDVCGHAQAASGVLPSSGASGSATNVPPRSLFRWWRRSDGPASERPLAQSRGGAARGVVTVV